MVRIGPYKQVYESHRTSFLKAGYSETDAGAIAQRICAQPLPESACIKSAHYLEANIPNAEAMLECDQYTGVSTKVSEAIQDNIAMFRDNDDPARLTALVSGVYPGTPGLAVLKVYETGNWYAVDWALVGNAVKLENPRDIGSFYETLSVSVTEGIMPAISLVLHERETALLAEQLFLTEAVVDGEFFVPGVVLDGTRPVEEMEFVKFLRNSKVLTESFATPFQIEEKTYIPDIPDAIGRLAMVTRKLQKLERASFGLTLALAMPRIGAQLSEKATTLQTVVISKDKFTESEMKALAKRNSWGADRQDSSSSYRLRQFDPKDCEAGSYATITLKEGVEGVICRRKSAKNESVSGRRFMTEAGDFMSIGGHSVFVDKDKAGAGEFDDVTKQIKAHNRMRKVLEDNDFKKNGSGGYYGDSHGEEHVKDAGNGYNARVTVAGGKAHTSIHRNGGTMVKAIGTAANAAQLQNNIESAMTSCASQPEITGYST